MATAEPAAVFISYAHEDEKLRRELDQHLKGLELAGIVRAWHDRQILPGQTWANEIDNALDKSQIVLLLVSKGFLDSDYCFQKELARALELHARGSCTVIPVILSAVRLGENPLCAAAGVADGCQAPHQVPAARRWLDECDRWH